jgi:hypothetical protein
MAKPPLVDEAQVTAIEADDKTRVRLNRRRPRHDEDIAGHPHVPDDGEAAVEGYQQVLAAAAHVLDRAASGAPGEERGSGRTDDGAVQDRDPADPGPGDLPAETAGDRFDVGQLRHWRAAARGA